jgi:hypothetical protein
MQCSWKKNGCYKHLACLKKKKEEEKNDSMGNHLTRHMVTWGGVGQM